MTLGPLMRPAACHPSALSGAQLLAVPHLLPLRAHRLPHAPGVLRAPCRVPQPLLAEKGGCLQEHVEPWSRAGDGGDKVVEGA